MKKMNQLKNKYILVTGASAGIGFQIAKDFLLEGAFVGIHYSNNQKGAKKLLKFAKKNQCKLLKSNFSNSDEISNLWNEFITWSKNRIDVLGGVLSGGEQQMLTICRSLMGCPKLIMIDEPTEGLSPQMVGNVEKLLKKISEKGVSILLVEQKLTIAFNLSKRLFIMGHGKVVYEGTPVDINNNQSIIKEWLEVS